MEERNDGSATRFAPGIAAGIAAAIGVVGYQVPFFRTAHFFSGQAFDVSSLTRALVGLTTALVACWALVACRHDFGRASVVGFALGRIGPALASALIFSAHPNAGNQFGTNDVPGIGYVLVLVSAACLVGVALPWLSALVRDYTFDASPASRALALGASAFLVTAFIAAEQPSLSVPSFNATTTSALPTVVAVAFAIVVPLMAVVLREGAAIATGFAVSMLSLIPGTLDYDGGTPHSTVALALIGTAFLVGLALVLLPSRAERPATTAQLVARGNDGWL